MTSRTSVALTGLALVVISIVLALMFSSRGYDARSVRNAEALTAAETWVANCDRVIATLSVDFHDATKDPSDLRLKVAEVLSAREATCTQAKVALQAALDTHPPDEAQLVQMMQRIDADQDWLVRISQAFANYENAVRAGSGATELAALQALVH
ncbi:MAG TPA: hypothetical protein VLB44_05665 [Kofleriaceae bacterium]|nr:hypothetical protein [Kofleriaceae bacterium]